jgi:hypothetical protein
LSQHTVIDIELNDEKSLVEALEKMGYKVAVHENAVPIKTYDRTKVKANVVIDKSQGFRWGDVGFERTKTGYKMHIDDTDQKYFDTGKLKQLYSESKITRAINSRSKYTIVNRDVTVDGKIKLKIKVNF